MEKAYINFYKIILGLPFLIYAFLYYKVDLSSTDVSHTLIYKLSNKFSDNQSSTILVETIGIFFYFIGFLLIKSSGIYKFINILMSSIHIKFSLIRKVVLLIFGVLLLVIVLPAISELVDSTNVEEVFAIIHRSMGIFSLFSLILLSPIFFNQSELKECKYEETVNAENKLVTYKLNGRQFAYRKKIDGDYEKVVGQSVEFSYTSGYILNLGRYYEMVIKEIKFHPTSVEVILSDIKFNPIIENFPPNISASNIDNLLSINPATIDKVAQAVHSWLVQEKNIINDFVSISNIVHTNFSVENILESPIPQLMEKQEALTNQLKNIEKIKNEYSKYISQVLKNILKADESWMETIIGRINIPEFENKRKYLQQQIDKSLEEFARQNGITQDKILSAWLEARNKIGSIPEKADVFLGFLKIKKPTKDFSKSKSNTEFKILQSPNDILQINNDTGESIQIVASKLLQIVQDNPTVNNHLLTQKIQKEDIFENQDDIKVVVNEINKERKQGNITLSIIKSIIDNLQKNESE